MTRPGKFQADINRAAQLLRDLNFLSDQNEWAEYDGGLPGRVRDMSYLDEYRYYATERIYDFLLVDNSVIQFKLLDGGCSFCYYQIPIDVPSYEQFISETFNFSADDIALAGDSFQEDYQLVLDTSQLRKSVTPIRYDYSPEQYREGIHPAAHLHIGSSNDIRLHTSRKMTPMAFMLFVLRQMYPSTWALLLERDDAAKICRSVRDELKEIEKEHYCSMDSYQLMLH